MPEEEKDICIMNNIEVPRTQQEVLADPFSIYPSNVFSPDSKGSGIMKWDFPRGHTPTNYYKWLTHRTGEIYPLECVSIGFEPYIAVQNCQHLPPPQDQFIVGYDKVSWVRHLSSSGYHFNAIAGDAFCIHLPHAIAQDEKRTKEVTEKLFTTKKKLYDYLDNSLNSTSTRIPVCGKEKVAEMIIKYILALDKYHNYTKNITFAAKKAEKRATNNKDKKVGKKMERNRKMAKGEASSESNMFQNDFERIFFR